MTNRQLARQALLRRSGWEDATAVFLAGDASDRTYERLAKDGETTVLMDAPRGKGDDPAAFIAVARHLLQIGLSAPQILDHDLVAGYLLLEDFGDRIFARVTEAEPNLETQIYAAAIDALVVLQSNPAMVDLPELSAAEWATAATLVLNQYRGAICADTCEEGPFVDCLSELLDREGTRPNIMILRDFHAENLIWLPHRKAAARAGLLDFQLAQLGHPIYDVVSLLQDARRDVSDDTARQAMRRYCDAMGWSADQFHRAAATWGAQRALRILGVFARLALTSGKTSYLGLMPRVWRHLMANLEHPQLAGLQRICMQLLPMPTEAVLLRLAQTSRQ